MSEYRLVVHAPHGRVFSVNDDHSKGGRWQVTARRNAWKHDTWIKAKHAKIPSLGRIEVEPTIHLRNWRRADAQNYPSASSLKGLLDGLVAAGVVADDRAPFMDVRMPRLAPLDGGPARVELVIRQVGAR